METRTVKKLICFMVCVVTVLSMAGCQQSGEQLASGPPETTETAPAITEGTGTTVGQDVTVTTAPEEPTHGEEVETTAPKETEPVETTKATEPKETEPPATQATEPPATKPVETEPPETQPPVTEPPVTEPPATEPPHEHSYSATGTVAATCNSQGYTTYACSCGESYSDNYTPVLGHSWGEWTTTVEATSEAEGQQTRTCATCGAAETQAIAKLPAEVIDTAALEEYGRQYGANTYGFEIDVGTRAGYFPGYCCRFTSMADAYQEVAECVATTAEAIIAYGNKIVVEFEDGTVGRVGLDVEVCHDHDDIYYVWVYYG